MLDNYNCVHDLAVAAATVTARLNFDNEAVGDTPDEKRKAFADYLKDEYEYFFDYYSSLMR